MSKTIILCVRVGSSSLLCAESPTSARSLLKLAKSGPSSVKELFENGLSIGSLLKSVTTTMLRNYDRFLGSAPEGSVRHSVCRRINTTAANFVNREHPDTRFLQSLAAGPSAPSSSPLVPSPSSTGLHMLIWPGDDPRDVRRFRRRMRLLALNRPEYHRTWLRVTGAASLMFVPLFLLPGPPNVPFFLLAYRAFVHFQAAAGAIILRQALGLQAVNHPLQPAAAAPSEVIKIMWERLAAAPRPPPGGAESDNRSRTDGSGAARGSDLEASSSSESPRGATGSSTGNGAGMHTNASGSSGGSSDSGSESGPEAALREAVAAAAARLRWAPEVAGFAAEHLEAGVRFRGRYRL